MVDEKSLTIQLRQFPLDWNVRFQLLDRLQARGAQREVIHVLDGATRPPTELAALKKIIDLSTWAGEPSVAWRPMDDFLRDHPDSARGHYLMTKLLVRLGDLALARRHYHRAINLDPSLQDDMLADKIAGRIREEAAAAAQAPSYTAGQAPVSSGPVGPRPLSPPRPKTGVSATGRPPLTPLIDVKTEPVKLPPPMFRVAEETASYFNAPPTQAPQSKAQPEPEAENPAFDPVPERVPSVSPKASAPVQQSHSQPVRQIGSGMAAPPPMFPPPPPAQAAPSWGYQQPEPQEEIYEEPEPVYQDDPAYAEDYGDYPAEEEVAPQPAAPGAVAPQFGSVAPLRPPVVESGWGFLHGSAQPDNRRSKDPQPKKRKRGTDAPYGSTKPPRKAGGTKFALICLVMALGHTSIFLAPTFLVSEIPNNSANSVATAKVVTAVVP